MCGHWHWQLDGAKLVSVNNRDEHTFIVHWLAEHAKQGYVFACCCEFYLLCNNWLLCAFFSSAS